MNPGIQSTSPLDLAGVAVVTFFSIGRHYNYHRTLLLAGAVYERRGVGYEALFTQVFLGDKFLSLMRTARRHTPSTITPTSLAVGGRPLEGGPCLGISCKLLVPPPSPPSGGGTKNCRGVHFRYFFSLEPQHVQNAPARPGHRRCRRFSVFGFRGFMCVTKSPWWTGKPRALL